MTMTWLSLSKSWIAFQLIIQQPQCHGHHKIFPPYIFFFKKEKKKSVGDGGTIHHFHCLLSMSFLFLFLKKNKKKKTFLCGCYDWASKYFGFRRKKEPPPKKRRAWRNEERSPTQRRTTNTLNTLFNNSSSRYVTVKDQGLDIFLWPYSKTFSKWTMKNCIEIFRLPVNPLFCVCFFRDYITRCCAFFTFQSNE